MPSMTSIEQSLILRKLGRLAETDRQQLQEALQKILGPWACEGCSDIHHGAGFLYFALASLAVLFRLLRQDFRSFAF